MDNLPSGQKILVVEDEMLILTMIESMLNDLGCTSVTTVTKNEQAIDAIGHQMFDIAMLDMNLNGNSSFDVADALAEKGIPFVYSTGNNILDERDGFSDRPILKKPFSEEDLAKTLASLMPH